MTVPSNESHSLDQYYTGDEDIENEFFSDYYEFDSIFGSSKELLSCGPYPDLNEDGEQIEAAQVNSNPNLKYNAGHCIENNDSVDSENKRTHNNQTIGLPKIYDKFSLFNIEKNNTPIVNPEAIEILKSSTNLNVGFGAILSEIDSHSSESYLNDPSIRAGIEVFRARRSLPPCVYEEYQAFKRYLVNAFTEISMFKHELLFLYDKLSDFCCLEKKTRNDTRCKDTIIRHMFEQREKILPVIANNLSFFCQAIQSQRKLRKFKKASH